MGIRNKEKWSLSGDGSQATAYELVILAVLSDMGLVSKKIIHPFSNFITDALHIPGGIGTGFSLMFLVLAVRLVGVKFAGSKMGLLQSLTALCLGMIGSMGGLSVVGYVVPGLVIDLTALYARKVNLPETEYFVFANMLSSLAAAGTANLIVFGLRGWPLLLYFGVASMTGLLCGVLGCKIYQRIPNYIKEKKDYEKQK